MAAPEFKNIGTEAVAGGTVSSLDVAYPTTVDEDDLIVMTLSNAKYQINTPAGWTLIGAVGTYNSYVTTVFYQIADGTETGNVTTSMPSESTNGYFGVMATYSGVDVDASPLFEDVTYLSGTGTTYDLKDVTNNDDEDKLAIAGGLASLSNSGWTNYTQDFEGTLFLASMPVDANSGLNSGDTITQANDLYRIVECVLIGTGTISPAETIYNINGVALEDIRNINS